MIKMENPKRTLTGEEEQILKLFGSVIPNMSPIERARLLGIGEGLMIRQEQQERQTG